MAGARLALVVANEDYADDGLRRLAAPGRDADALAEILGDRSVGGFDVQVLRNESAQQVRFAIEDFFADRSPTDLLLVHFSCHGVKNGSGELFLAAADTRPTRLASTAVAADFVNRQMADSRANASRCSSIVATEARFPAAWSCARRQLHRYAMPLP